MSEGFLAVRRPVHVRRWVRALSTVAALAATACGDRAPRLTPGTGQFRGIEVADPRPRPAFTLPATDGTPFDFIRETEGRVTLLFFGYTHCPDICPVHLANIAAVLRRQPADVRERIRVVFVTTDPERDSASVIRRWLDNFDPTFVGLRGPSEEVNAIQASIGLPPAVITRDARTGRPDVSHAAVVVAYDRDGRHRLTYPFGTRQDDWARDLPLLATGRWVAPPDGGGPRTTGETMRIGGLTVRDPRVPVLYGGSALAAYLTLTLDGPADWLLGVQAPGLARTAMLHAVREGALGRTTMAMLDSLEVPGGRDVVLAPGGTHVMLEGLLRDPSVGDRVPLVLTFRRQGRVTVPARAVPADAAER